MHLNNDSLVNVMQWCIFHSTIFWYIKTFIMTFSVEIQISLLNDSYHQNNNIVCAIMDNSEAKCFVTINKYLE